MAIKIFIAEDQPLIRRGISAIVESEADMTVCGEASECANAWREVCRLRPNVVILELSLRSKSTIGLIRRICALEDSIFVVVYSRHDEQFYAIPSFKAGARAFVMKDDTPEAVIDAVRKVHEGQLRFSENVGSQILNRITTHRQDRSTGIAPALSPRELEVVTLIANGHTSREIADQLKVSIKTVEAHRAHIKQKANLENGTALVRFSMNVTNENPLVEP